MQDIGFAILVGHGIEESFYDESAKLVEEMFTQTSSETKNRYTVASTIATLYTLLQAKKNVSEVRM